jgi:hypothetical protein
MTRVLLGARGFSSRSLGSLRMPSPQGVQLWALGSENITQPSLKEPARALLVHLVMEPEAGSQ